MKARLHDDLNEFVALARPLLEADPIRHSIALTVIEIVGTGSWGQRWATGATDCEPGDALAAAVVCTPPREVIVSGLPTDCAGAAVEALAARYSCLPGAVGPRPEAEMFARRWSARSGAVAHERIAQRAFALYRLTPPSGVLGVARRAGVADVESNPISNAIYPRIGFRPVYDAVEIAFDRRPL